MGGMNLSVPGTERARLLTTVSRSAGLQLTHLRVRVCMDHFERGVRCDAGNCMFKLALLDTLGAGFVSGLVDIREIRFSYKPARVRIAYNTPRSLANKIVAWDNGASAEEIGVPFEYVLSAPVIWHMADRRRGAPVSEPTPAQLAARSKGLAAMHESRGIAVGSHRPTPRGEVPAARRRQYGLRALESGLSATLEG